MKFICDAPDGKTWFRMETEGEAFQESELMQHAVEKHFHRAKEKAEKSFRPISQIFVEQELGLNAHVQREMPMFLTLRDSEGNGLVTAMLPPNGRDDASFRKIIVGVKNSDPYPIHEDAIRALGAHFNVSLERDDCFPYT